MPLLLLAMALACTPPTEPDTAEPPEAPDGAPGDDPCGVKCERQRVLGCSGGEPTKAGHSCEEVCRNAQNNGIDLAGDEACVRRAKECAAILVCSE